MAADPAGVTFHAMGTDAHVIVVGGPDGLERRARDRVAQLERRWSRFVDDSEISTLNRYAGAPVKVSRDTVVLVKRAIDAWHLTNGLFDATVLGSMLRAGYDRSFEALGSDARSGSSDLACGTDAIEILDDIIRLPHGTGFDPGGIGKGLAADIVAAELAAAGAEGACVNLGGDVRVFGPSPRGDAWTIAIDHPRREEPITRLGVTDGAAATSTTLRRQWRVDGETRHHLIDTATGAQSTSDLTFVTVVAGNAWAAEVLAKAVLLHGTPHHFDILVATGADGLAVDTRGRVTATPGMPAYLGDARLPSVTDDLRAREEPSREEPSREEVAS
jgi:thiamine biosynthesis lipoprotein